MLCILGQEQRFKWTILCWINLLLKFKEDLNQGNKGTNLTTCLCLSTQYLMALRTIISCFLVSPLGLATGPPFEPALKDWSVDGARNCAPQSALVLYIPVMSMSEVGSFSAIKFKLDMQLVDLHSPHLNVRTLVVYQLRLGVGRKRSEKCRRVGSVSVQGCG